ncbi:MAG: hypothetical protein H0U49_07305, partial [Parachlamydiaceae bacterium]|nr:hypothetical protein [Parachlamydiaceae bacterium]
MNEDKHRKLTLEQRLSVRRKTLQEEGKETEEKKLQKKLLVKYDKNNEKITTLKEKCILLDQILTITESKADSLIDEVDLILDRLHELNFVDGEKNCINSVSNELLLSLYKALISEDLFVEGMPGKPTVHDVVRLRQNDQSLLKTKMQQYIAHIVPVIANHLTETFEPMASLLPASHKNSLVRYLSGRISANLNPYLLEEKILTEELARKEFPNSPFYELEADLAFLRYFNKLPTTQFEKSKSLADLIALAKHFLLELMPVSLTKEGGRNYGQSTGKAQNGKKIPYLGVLNPATTEFGYHWENASYQYQWGAAFKPDKDSVFFVADFLMAAANHYIEEKGEKLQETAEYQCFEELFGVTIDKIREEGVVEKAIENIFENPEKCLDMQFELAEQFATYA